MRPNHHVSFFAECQGAGMTGEWVTNDTADPDFHAREDGGMLREDYARWRRKFDVGDPKATRAYTVEQLREMGMVGLYRRKA